MVTKWRGDLPTLSTTRHCAAVRLVAVRVVLLVPGGVDQPGSTRVIPFIHDLVRRLAVGHEVTIIAIGHNAEPGEWRLYGCRVVNVPIGGHSRTDVLRAVRATMRLSTVGGRPDVVHAFWAGVTGLASGVIGQRFRVPSVVSVCGGELAAVTEIGYGGGLTRGGRLLARSALRLATTTTAATDWMVTHVTTAGGHIDELVPLGADRSRFAPVGGVVRPVDAAHIVHVASLNAVKDQRLALQAFALVRAERPDATLTLAGVDTMDGTHIALATRLGIADAVRCLGFVQPDDLVALLRSAVVHLNTSWHEAGPLAVLEAAMCGLPTVGTRVGHVADLAALPEPAAVAVDRNAAAVAGAIMRLLTNPAERHLIGQRAAAWSIAHDADHTAASFNAIYRRLTARSSSTAAASSGDAPRPST